MSITIAPVKYMDVIEANGTPGVRPIVGFEHDAIDPTEEMDYPLSTLIRSKTVTVRFIPYVYVDETYHHDIFGKCHIRQNPTED